MITRLLYRILRLPQRVDDFRREAPHCRDRHTWYREVGVLPLLFRTFQNGIPQPENYRSRVDEEKQVESMLRVGPREECAYGWLGTLSSG